MKTAARALWIHLCVTLIVLPVGGWCWLPIMYACQASEKAKPCCAKHSEAPVQPQAPSKFPRCCCKPQQALLRTALDDSPQDPVNALPSASTPTSTAMPALAAPMMVSVVGDPSPPLHLLHCVWLC